MTRSTLQSLPTELVVHIAELLSTHDDKCEDALEVEEPRMIICRCCLFNLRLTCREINHKIQPTWLKGFSNVIGNTDAAGLIQLSNIAKVETWARRVSTLTIHWPKEGHPVGYDELHEKFPPVLRSFPSLETVRVVLDIRLFLESNGSYYGRLRELDDQDPRTGPAERFYLATLSAIRASSIKLRGLHVGLFSCNPEIALEYLDLDELSIDPLNDSWLSEIEKLSLAIHFPSRTFDRGLGDEDPEIQLLLADLIASAPALRELSLRFRSNDGKAMHKLFQLRIPHLEVLELESFREKAAPLALFIQQHQQTLRQVSLTLYEIDGDYSNNDAESEMNLLLDALSHCRRLEFLMLHDISRSSYPRPTYIVRFPLSTEFRFMDDWESSPSTINLGRSGFT